MYMFSNDLQVIYKFTGYVPELMTELVSAADDQDILSQMHEHVSILKASLPPPLTAAFQSVDREAAKQSYGTMSRFSTLL